MILYGQALVYHLEKKNSALLRAKIATLEGLLEEVDKAWYLFIQRGYYDFFCACCHSVSSQNYDIKHKPDCLFTRIHKELGGK